jgi:cysteine-rich repeat protein
VITVVRTVNVIANCSVRLRAASSTGYTAVPGTDFATLDVPVTFAPGQTQQSIAVAVSPSTVFRGADATFSVILWGPFNCTLASASLIIAIRGVIPPAVRAPSPAPAPSADRLVFRWAAPAWPRPPPAPWDSPLQFEALCSWTNAARGLSGVYPSLLINDSDPNGGSAAAPTWSVTLTTLAAGTSAQCQARMYAAGGWGDFGSLSVQAATASACGNGWREAGEECDDGNNAVSDGCGIACSVEMGWACATSAPGQPDGCSAGCGNLTLAGVEECDDGNVMAGDGCGPSCRVEVGWVCSRPAAEGMPSVCSTVCGDGVWVGPANEGCDDGNVAGGDGCSSACTVEPGAVCAYAGGYGGGSVCHICGNMRVESGEACDEGNNSGACAADCASVRAGWSCAPAGGPCTGGPLPPPQPECTELGVSWVAWEWGAADGLGLPVLYYECRIMPAAFAAADWGAAAVLNTTAEAASVRQRLVVMNLSAATAYLLRVRACSAAGCGAAGPDSFAATTLAAAYLELQALGGAGFADQAQAAGRAVGLNVSGVSVLVPTTPPQPLPPTDTTGLLNESEYLALMQGQKKGPVATSSPLHTPSTTAMTAAVMDVDAGGWGVLSSYFNVTVQVLSHESLLPALAYI